MQNLQGINSADTSELTPLQREVGNKVAFTAQKVVQEALLTFMSPPIRALSGTEFLAKYVTPKYEQLSNVDERTRAFSAKMMGSIGDIVTKMPPLLVAATTLNANSHDPQCWNKFIEGTALPHVKSLMTELDTMGTHIVDDIIHGN